MRRRDRRLGDVRAPSRGHPSPSPAPKAGSSHRRPRSLALRPERPGAPDRPVHRMSPSRAATSALSGARWRRRPRGDPTGGRRRGRQRAAPRPGSGQQDTVRPSAAVSRRSARTSAWSSGSSPVVGSSRTTRLGRCMNAWTIPIFCRFPFDSWRIGRSSSTSSRLQRSTRSGSWTPPRRRASESSCSRPVSRSASRRSPGRYPTCLRDATASRFASRPKSNACPAVG